MNTKEEVHQKLADIVEPYLAFSGELPPTLKEEIEEALLPLESEVIPIPPRATTLVMFYRFPTDEKAMFRRVEMVSSIPQPTVSITVSER